MKKLIAVLLTVLIIAVVSAGSFVFFAQGTAGTAGDADLDGYVTAQDAMLVLRTSSGLAELNALQTVRADVTYDGKIDSVDALRILMYVAGNISDLDNAGSEEGDSIII